MLQSSARRPDRRTPGSGSGRRPAYVVRMSAVVAVSPRRGRSARCCGCARRGPGRPSRPWPVRRDSRARGRSGHCPGLSAGRGPAGARGRQVRLCADGRGGGTQRTRQPLRRINYGFWPVLSSPVALLLPDTNGTIGWLEALQRSTHNATGALLAALLIWPAHEEQRIPGSVAGARRLLHGVAALLTLTI
jgi:hypothetical protein